MNIISFFLRFTGIYAVLMSCAGILAALLGMESGSGINTGILFGISYWFFFSYANKKGLFPIGSEKWKLIFTALLGDIVVSVTLGSLTMISLGHPISVIFIGLVIVAPFHLLIIFGASHFAKTQYRKSNPDEQDPTVTEKTSSA